jgi:hypothetical protein
LAASVNVLAVISIALANALRNSSRAWLMAVHDVSVCTCVWACTLSGPAHCLGMDLGGVRFR